MVLSPAAMAAQTSGVSRGCQYKEIKDVVVVAVAVAVVVGEVGGGRAEEWRGRAGSQ